MNRFYECKDEISGGKYFTDKCLKMLQIHNFDIKQCNEKHMFCHGIEYSQICIKYIPALHRRYGYEIEISHFSLNRNP